MKSIDQDKAKLYQRKAISIENWKGGEAYRIIPSDTLKEYFIEHIQSGDFNILESDPTIDERVKSKSYL